jgi:ubiquitin-protein ligase
MSTQSIVWPPSAWQGGVYEFTFNVPNDYPFKEPKVKCIDKVRVACSTELQVNRKGELTFCVL